MEALKVNENLYIYVQIKLNGLQKMREFTIYTFLQLTQQNLYRF